MLRMNSQQLKNAVDKLRPPTFVKLSRDFLDNEVCCKRERLQHNFKQLQKMTALCRITTLDFHSCGITGQNICYYGWRGQDLDRLARVLAQCPDLSVLHLDNNQLGPEGTGRLGNCGSTPRDLETWSAATVPRETWSAATVPSAQRCASCGLETIG
jgi:hypothetical protein